MRKRLAHCVPVNARQARRAGRVERKQSMNKIDNGTLHNLQTGEAIRPATAAEEAASIAAAAKDGGIGAIVVDSVTCYVA